MSNLEQAEMQTQLPIQIITERLGAGDDTGNQLWRFCANAWLATDIGDQVTPEDFFQPDIDPEENESNGYPDNDDDPDDEDGPVVEDEDANGGLNDEQLEEIVLERPYMDALVTFWSEMDVFKRASNIPEWEGVVATVRKMVTHVPSDLAKLCDHIERINKSRIAAEALLARQAVIAGSILYDITKERF